MVKYVNKFVIQPLSILELHEQIFQTTMMNLAINAHHALPNSRRIILKTFFTGADLNMCSITLRTEPEIISTCASPISASVVPF
jgi:hypothetical protein